MSVHRPAGDDGSVLLLVVGLFVLLLGLVGVVVDVSAVVLSRRALASSADGAAISAAQALDYQVFYAQGPGRGVPLSEVGVRERVAGYLADVAGDQPGLQMSARVEAGYTVVVTARRTVALPVGSGWLGIGDVELSTVARARAPLTPP